MTIIYLQYNSSITQPPEKFESDWWNFLCNNVLADPMQVYIHFNLFKRKRFCIYKAMDFILF
jgi:hypothetical protein